MKNKLNMQPLTTFLHENADMGELSKILDEVIFEYVYRKIEKGDECIGDDTEICNNIYYLRHLRDLFFEMSKTVAA